jgi:putative transposase
LDSKHCPICRPPEEVSPRGEIFEVDNNAGHDELFFFFNQQIKDPIMTHNENTNVVTEAMQAVLENGLEGMGTAFVVLLNEAMKIERSKFIGAQPWERTQERRGHANGFKPKRLDTRMGKLDLQIPQVRGDESFYPSALEQGQRSERALKLALAEMYIQGVSTRKVTKIMETLCGTQVSSSQVSRATALLDDELEKWRCRPLEEIPYLILDARYEKVRQDGAVRSCAVLIATGVNTEGKRSILGVSVSLSEAEIHWRDFLRSLKSRGLMGVKMITTDDHEGLKSALKSCFGGVPWQRCQVHIQRNATAHIPKKEMRSEVAQDIRDIFNAPSTKEAERLLEIIIDKYQEKASKLAAWMADNIPDGFSVFQLPKHQRKRLRTTNMAENINKQLKRRTRVASLFPNEASLLRLASAILIEISEEWEAGKRYIKMDDQ